MSLEYFLLGGHDAFLQSHVLSARLIDRDGPRSCECLERPGCFAAGDTLDEMQACLLEARRLYDD